MPLKITKYIPSFMNTPSNIRFKKQFRNPKFTTWKKIEGATLQISNFISSTYSCQKPVLIYFVSRWHRFTKPAHSLPHTKMHTYDLHKTQRSQEQFISKTPLPFAFPPWLTILYIFSFFFFNIICWLQYLDRLLEK